MDIKMTINKFYSAWNDNWVLSNVRRMRMGGNAQLSWTRQRKSWLSEPVSFFKIGVALNRMSASGCFTNRTHTWISRCIMALHVFKEYKGRPMGQDILNRKLQIYGVKIITVREFKRNENCNRTFWKLIRIWYDFGAKIVLTLYIIGTKNEPSLENKKK